MGGNSERSTFKLRVGPNFTKFYIRKTLFWLTPQKRGWRPDSVKLEFSPPPPKKKKDTGTPHPESAPRGTPGFLRGFTLWTTGSSYHGDNWVFSDVTTHLASRRHGRSSQEETRQVLLSLWKIYRRNKVQS